MNSIVEAIYANSVKPKPKVRQEIKITWVKRGRPHEEIMADIRLRIAIEEADEKKLRKELSKANKPKQDERKLTKVERKRRQRKRRKKNKRASKRAVRTVLQTKDNRRNKKGME